MTENKRFEKTKSDIRTFRIYDYEKEDAYFLDCDNHTVECLVDVLNEQHEENELLKKEYREMEIKVGKLKGEIGELFCENEQLKKDNNELENEIEKLENRLWNCQNVR